jgi:DNA-binding NtrC family response regulator
MQKTPNCTTSSALPIEVQYHGISILIVDDEPGICELLQKALSRLFRHIDTAGSIKQAEQLRRRNQYDVVLLDVNLPDRSGTEWYEIFNDEANNADVIFITGYASLQTAIQALKLGASDFLLKPFNLDQIITAVKKCVNNRIEKRVNIALTRDVKRYTSSGLIGNSVKSQTLLNNITHYAPSRAAVLIQGESGTGKELVARELHVQSGRSGAFVPVNCGAGDSTDLANELFGYCDPNGVKESSEGLLKLANGGTLFLDEICELPPSVQSALLRVLEEQVVRPLGSSRSFTTNVRIIAATNKDLNLEVESGNFRQDLFYRLNVLSIYVSPLRERREDLTQLIPYYTERLAVEQGVEIPKWSEEELASLHEYHWPGNIRELKNLIERCILTGKSVSYHWQDILPTQVQRPQIINVTHDGINSTLPIMEQTIAHGYPDNWDLKEVEKAHIIQVVNDCKGNKTAASKVLKVSRKTLDRKFKEWEP